MLCCRCATLFPFRATLGKAKKETAGETPGVEGCLGSAFVKEPAL
jgi:hypothetical protein